MASIPKGRFKKAAADAKPEARECLNCLRCGFVNTVVVARRKDKDEVATNAYARAVARCSQARASWGRCAFCYDALSEQLRHGDADVEDASLDKAVALQSRLVEYDRDCAQRTAVIDDECDWYSVATSPWASPAEAAQAWANEEARRAAVSDQRTTFAIDLAGRRVVEESDDDGPASGVASARAVPEYEEPPCAAPQLSAAASTFVPPPPPDAPFSIVREGHAADAGLAAATLLSLCETPAAQAFPPLAPRRVVDRPAERTRGAVALRPGLVLLRGALAADAQQAVVDVAHAAGTFVYPEFDNGNRLHCRMSCFGLRWDAETKGYVDSGLPPVPDALRALATWVVGQAVAVDASVLGSTTRFDPDLLLANFYTAQGKMGLHQDTSERRGTLDSGSPVVSISIGAAADFVFADRRPGVDSGLSGAANDGLTRIQLGSGDFLVFGGPARLVYHGVEKILEGRKPTPGLALKPGRLNLTFRMH